MVISHAKDQWLTIHQYNRLVMKWEKYFRVPDDYAGSRPIIIKGKGILSGPSRIPGGVGVVFVWKRELEDGTQKRVAVKCYHRPVTEELSNRYLEFKKWLESRKPSLQDYFAKFTYLPDGILVDSRRYPVLWMEFIEGPSLLNFIIQNLHDTRALLHVSDLLKDMVSLLFHNGMAHGDLSHTNILVTPNKKDKFGISLKLIDYDGVFIPQFEGKVSLEEGNLNFQHPHRGGQNKGIFNRYLDLFPFLLLQVTLRILAEDSSAWQLFHGPDDQATTDFLLFTRADLVSMSRQRPVVSPQLKQIIDTVSDKHVKEILAAMSEYAHSPIAKPPKTVLKSLKKFKRFFLI